MPDEERNPDDWWMIYSPWELAQMVTEAQELALDWYHESLQPAPSLYDLVNRSRELKARLEEEKRDH